MPSPLYSLIPFSPLFCQLSTPELNSVLLLAACGSRYTVSGGLTTENTTLSVVACWFIAPEMCLQHSCVATSAVQTHRERRLQHLFYCCVTSQRTWHVLLLRVYGPLPRNGCFSSFTVLALSKYATILISLETTCFVGLLPAIRHPLWSSGQSFWLQIQRSRVRFPALPDILRSRESGTGSTQRRENNWGATWMKN
jgi:hypothetical protein